MFPKIIPQYLVGLTINIDKKCFRYVEEEKNAWTMSQIYLWESIQALYSYSMH